MNLFNLSFIEKLLNTIMQKLNNSFAYKLLKKWNLTFEADYVRVSGRAVTEHKYVFLFYFVCVYMYLCMSPIISIIVSKQENIFMFSDCTARSEPIKYHHKSIHI
jgi:hypothetical protein